MKKAGWKIIDLRIFFNFSGHTNLEIRLILSSIEDSKADLHIENIFSLNIDASYFAKYCLLDKILKNAGSRFARECLWAKIIRKWRLALSIRLFQGQNFEVSDASRFARAGFSLWSPNPSNDATRFAQDWLLARISQNFTRFITENFNKWSDLSGDYAKNWARCILIYQYYLYVLRRKKFISENGEYDFHYVFNIFVMV